jgi:biotin carboxylase
MSSNKRRVLLLATTTGYQIRAFDEAAADLGIDLVLASDRCDQLDDPWRDRAIAVRYHDIDRSVASLSAALSMLGTRNTSQVPPVAGTVGVLAVGDRPTVLAAHVAERSGIRWHSAAAAECSRDKVKTRERFREAGLITPEFQVVESDESLDQALARAARLLPCVVKPVVLSGSRGVMRANTSSDLQAAGRRLRRLLESRDVRSLRDPQAGRMLIERFVEGREYAVEGVLTEGVLQVLAVFDKPDALDGPFFEETIYVTPSRASAKDRVAMLDGIGAAVRALGLEQGPIHAECRIGPAGVTVLEVAARPIGGLCARAVHLVNPESEVCGLEALLLRHALREQVHSWQPAAEASAVMMVPIPAAGIYRGVEGVEAARHVPGVTDVRITAKVDHMLTPLPEGATYLGFVFARDRTPAGAERAVREAHAQLRFRIDRAVRIVEIANQR